MTAALDVRQSCTYSLAQTLLGFLVGPPLFVLVVLRGWALFSEAALVLTHLKVLLCVGKPLKEAQLAGKRWSYFLYDLLSPWISLATVFAPQIAAAAAAALQDSVPQCCSGGALTADAVDQLRVQAGAAAGRAGRHIALLPATPQQQHACLLAATAAQGGAGFGGGSASRGAAWASSAGSGWPGSGLALAAETAAAEAVLSAAATTASSLATWLHNSPALWQLMVAVVVGHTLLHTFYITTWQTPHAKQVVSMSAMPSFWERFKRFGVPETAWFVLGTSYDIATHIMLIGVLLSVPLQS